MVFVVVTVVLSLSTGDGAGQAPAAPAEPGLPVSVERVRQRLQRPSALRPPPDPEGAHFKVEIEEDYFPRETVLDMLRRELAAEVTIDLPAPLVRKGQLLMAVDLLQVAAMLKGRISAVRRARAQRISRREVEEAVAAFCAAHDCSVLEQDADASLPEGILTH